MIDKVNDKLVLIGSSHIARESVREVRDQLDSFSPNIVAVELDSGRAQALMSKEKPKVSFRLVFEIGVTGYVFALIGSFASRKLGSSIGTMPGAEMKAAIIEAKKKKVPVEYIDQEIRITLRRFSDKITWKEKWNFVADIFKAMFNREKAIAELEGFTLDSVPSPEIIEKLIKKVRGRYPNVYLVLIEERNRVIAKKLTRLIAQNPNKKILAVMGAGHLSDVKALMNKMEAVPQYSYSFSVDEN